MKSKKSFIFIVPIFLLFGWLILDKPAGSASVFVSSAEKHRGICWVGGRQIVTTDELQKVADLGVNWISQTPFGWQRGHDNPEIGNQINAQNGKILQSRGETPCLNWT